MRVEDAGPEAHLVNSVCPLTQKNVLSLEEPLQDQAGCVFEARAIREYIKRRQRGNNPATHCPRSGCHTISLQSLSIATEVQRQQEQQAHATQRLQDDS